MIAVIFELIPFSTKTDDYFNKANELKHGLQDIDGFISIERFESLSTPGKYLSLSFWQDEQAVKTWRNQMEHRQAQTLGKDEIFDSYRLRVAEVIRDYTLTERNQAPDDSVLLFSD